MTFQKKKPVAIIGNSPGGANKQYTLFETQYPISERKRMYAMSVTIMEIEKKA